MYSKDFCKIYNEFGWNSAPEAFAENLNAWLKTMNIHPQTHLDLGCGTGVLCHLMSEAGLSSEGMDLSENMICIARKQYPEISFHIGNMITYKPDHLYDLVTSTEDAMNHILDPNDLSRVFENAYCMLNPGGYLVFDLLTESGIALGDPVEVDYDEKTRLRFHVTKAPNEVLSFKTAVYEDGRLLFEECIHEIYHDPQMVCSRLAEAGFTVIRCADSLLEDGLHGTCWYIAARKDQIPV